MKNRYKILVICTAVIWNFKAYSQSPVEIMELPSANITSLGVVNEVPVSLYNGLCNINIPLYEFQEDDISVPVYLTYNSAGVKPDVHPGWTGQNWSLQAGGYIMRKVNGIPDQAAWQQTAHFGDANNSVFQLGDTPGYLYNLEMNANGNWSGFDNIKNKASAKKWVETEPDQFIFNINGITGSFYVAEDHSICVVGSPDIKVELWNLSKIAFRPFMVTPAIGPVNGQFTPYDIQISGFKITMPDGMQYEFGRYGGITQENFFAIEATSNFFNEFDAGELCNTWYLSKIASPKGTQVIFHYRPAVESFSNGGTMTYPIASFYRTIAFEKTSGTAKARGIFRPFGPIHASSSSLYDKYDGDIIFASYLYRITGNNTYMQFDMDKSVELTYDYEAIASDLARQFLSYSMDVHGFSPRGSLAPMPGKLCYQIFRPDMDMAYQYYNNRDAYNFNVNVINNSPELGAIRDVGVEYLDLNNFQWFKLNKITIHDKISKKDILYWHFKYNNKADERLMLLSIRKEGLNGKKENPYSFEYENYYGKKKYPGNYKLPRYNSDKIDHWGYFNNVNSRITNLTDIELGGNYNNKRRTVPEYLYTGQLNRIHYPTGGTAEFTWEPNSYSIAVKRNSSTGNFFRENLSQPVYGGGLRIKKIEYTENGKSTFSKSYSYSEGILPCEIKYFWKNFKGRLYSNPNATYTTDRFISQNILPLAGKVNNIICYPTVTEIRQDLGKIVYEYSSHLTILDENFLNSIDVQRSVASSFTDKGLERGHLQKATYYDANNKIKQIESYSYAKNGNVERSYIPAINTRQVPILDGWAIEGASYKIYTYPYNLTKKSTQVYPAGENVPFTMNESYEYNSYNHMENKKMTDSKGIEHRTSYSYPYNNSGYREMINKFHLLAPVIDEKQYSRNELIWQKITDYIIQEYREGGPFKYRPVLYSIREGKPLSGLWNEVQFPHYNAKGNLLEKIENGSVYTVYLWKEDERYPWAIIENAKNTDIETLWREALISIIISGEVPTEDNILYHMRKDSRMASSHMTIYTYIPSVGIGSIEDNKGLKTNYEYDDLHRLQCIKDNDGNVIEAYDYHQKTE